MEDTQVSLSLMDQIFTSISDAIFMINKKGIILRANEAAHLFLESKNLTGLNIHHFFELSTKEPEEKELSSLTKIKTNERWAYNTVTPINEEIDLVIINSVSLDQYQELIDSAIDEVDADSEEGLVLFYEGKIMDVNMRFASLFHYSKKELINMDITDVIGNMENKSGSCKEKSLYYGVRRDKTTFPLQLTLLPNQNKVGNIALVKDLSKFMEYERKIETLAFFDELTNLPNKNMFYHVVDTGINKKDNSMFAIHYIDLDYFKAINQTLGYDFGDKLLQKSAERLEQFVKKHNGFVARVHGDEFLVFQKDAKNKENAVQFAEKLNNQFGKPIMIDTYEFLVSIRIGISLFPLNGAHASELVEHAHQAMIITKQEQHDYYNMFEASISRKLQTKLTLETELHRALAEEQFELFYQPQMNVHTKKVEGFEALLRWKHPQKGYIMPLDFIPYAEKTGLIIDIGRWVLEEACRQSKRWQEKGHDQVKISINISAKQLHQSDFISQIKSSLLRTGLEPNLLEIEITESAALTNEKYVLKTVQKIKDLGVSIAVDDFGTGYSSLKYLSLFPINRLKIDRMFMEGYEQNKIIVKSIIHLSHSLNVSVTAEGVETVEQLAFLRNLNCDQVQGYFISKPLPADKIVSFLK